MMFLIRCAFWMTLVSFFVPQDFAGQDLDLPFDTAGINIDADAAVGDWCIERETICEAGAEAARLGGFLANVAMDRIETAIDDYQEDQE